MESLLDDELALVVSQDQECTQDRALCAEQQKIGCIAECGYESTPTLLHGSLSDELAEERKKTLMLGQHVQELERMVEDCAKHGQELVARNAQLQNENSALRLRSMASTEVSSESATQLPRERDVILEGTGGCDSPTDIENNAQIRSVLMENRFLTARVRELESLNESLEGEVRNQRRENIELFQKLGAAANLDQAGKAPETSGIVGGGSGGTAGDTLELEALVAELHHRNKTLELQLAQPQSLTSSFDNGDKLDGRIDELRNELVNSEQQEWQVKSAAIGLAERNEELTCEYESMRKMLDLQLAQAQSVIPSDDQSKSMDGGLTEKNEELKCECELMRIRVTCITQSEWNTKQQHEEALCSIEHMERHCSELQNEFAAVVEAEQQARRSAQEAHNKAEEMQYECRISGVGHTAEDECNLKPSSENQPNRVDELQRECARLQEQVASAITNDIDVRKLVGELRDQISDSKRVECEAQRIAEDRLHRCEALEHRLKETEHNLSERAEEALTRCRQLQQQVVSATEGELEARRQVEQSLDKNRHLMKQCDHLREKVAESMDIKPVASVSKDTDAIREFESKQSQDDIDIMRYSLPAQLAEVGNGKIEHIVEKVSVSLDVQEVQSALKSGASTPGSGTGQHSECQPLEPEMERSPLLDAKQPSVGHEGALLEKSPIDILEVVEESRSNLSNDMLSAADWRARADKEIAAREAAETRLRAAVKGIDKLRPEYEQLREQAVQAVEAEREAHKRVNELMKRNKGLQQEIDGLQREVGTKTRALLKYSGDELWTCVGEGDQCGPPSDWKQKDLPSVDEFRQAAFKHECEDLRHKVSIAVGNEREASALAEQLQEQIANATRSQRISHDRAEEESRECVQLLRECGCLRNELSEREKAADVARPLLQAAAAEEAHHRCEELEFTCDHLRNELASFAKSTCSVRPLLEDAVAIEALHRCEELEKECERLRSRPTSTSVQPLWEDAVAVEALHRCEELERECEQLRKQLLEKTYVAESADTSLESELWSCLEEGLRRGRSCPPERSARECEELRKELASAIGAESEAQKQLEVSMKFTQQLQTEIGEFRIRIRRHESSESEALRRYRALEEETRQQVEANCLSTQEAIEAQRELQKWREQAACATEAERTARRSAEAAAELLRRKEELRQCKQAREQMARAVRAEKDTRRSAEAAIDLKRLIKDLGFADVQANVPSVSSIASSSSLPVDVVPTGGQRSKAPASPTFGF